MRILLIEDAESIRAVLTRQLEAVGLSLVTLDRFEPVADTLNTSAFDLIITDMYLPDGTGVDVAAIARKYSLPVILLSGDFGVENRDDVKAAGFASVLIKPVSLARLREAVEHHTGRDSSPIFPSEIYAPVSELSADNDAVDLTVVMEQMGELDETSLAVLARFPRMMHGMVDRISMLAGAGLTSEIAEVAHSLKGAARSAGAVKLGILCDRLQQDAERGNISMNAVPDLHREFVRVEHAIGVLCGHLDPR